MEEFSTTFTSITPIEPVQVPFDNDILLPVVPPQGAVVEISTINV